MLQLIRDKTSGWIASLIMAILIIPFAFWGINYYFGGTGEVIVASVDDKDINLAKYQRSLANFRQQIQSSPGVNPDEINEDVLKKMTLEKLIENELLNQTTVSARLRVSDKVVKETIKNIDQFKGEEGFNREFYRELISRSGMQPALFEEQLRMDMMSEQLQSAIIESDFVTGTSAAHAARLYNQKRDLRYTIITLEPHSATLAITDGEIEKYYKENSNRYSKPEMVKIAYIHLQPAMLADRVEVSEQDLRDFYETNKTSYDVAEQRRINEILVKTDKGATEEVVTGARNKAAQILAQIRSGKSFAEIVKIYTNDASLNLQEYAFIGKGLLPDVVDQIAFSMQQGAVSDVIQSEKGFHIIELKEIKGGELNTFEQAHAKVEEDFRLKQAEEKLYYDLAEELATLAYEHSDTLDIASEVVGLPLQQSEWFDRNGTQDGLTANSKVLNASFSEDVLKEGHNSEVLEIADSEVLVLRVIDHIDETVQPLAEVRDRVIADIKHMQSSAWAEKSGKEILAELQKGAALDDVAARRGITWQDAGSVTRSDVSVNRAILRTAFRMGKPQDSKPLYGSVALGTGDYAVIAVMGAHDPEPDSIKGAELTNIQRQLQAMYSGIIWQQFLAEIKREADIQTFEDRL